jgi:hypothetical protein
MHAARAGELSRFWTTCSAGRLTAGAAHPKLADWNPFSIAHPHPEPALSPPVGT